MFMLPEPSNTKQYALADPGNTNTGCAIANDKNATSRICKMRLRIPTILLIGSRFFRNRYESSHTYVDGITFSVYWFLIM